MRSARSATTLAAGAAIAALPALYAYGVRAVLRRTVRQVNAGDLDAALRGYADDVHLTFPGTSSWSGDHHGIKEVGDWLRRFAAVGVQLHPESILVSGPPWATQVAVLYDDFCEDPRGNVVYTNRGVLHARLVWGKVVRHQVFEDTQKVAEFDDYLRSAGRAVD